MLEDALLVGEPAGVAALFESGGILATTGDDGVARGVPAITAAATRMCTAGGAYVADPRRVLEARDTALTLAAGGVTVARRDAEGWRYAIALLLLDIDTNTTERGAR